VLIFSKAFKPSMLHHYNLVGLSHTAQQITGIAES